MDLGHMFAELVWQIRTANNVWLTKRLRSLMYLIPQDKRNTGMFFFCVLFHPARALPRRLIVRPSSVVIIFIFPPLYL